MIAGAETNLCVIDGWRLHEVRRHLLSFPVEQVGHRRSGGTLATLGNAGREWTVEAVPAQAIRFALGFVGGEVVPSGSSNGCVDDVVHGATSS